MIAENKSDLPEDPTGGGGALFEREDNFRSDAKLAARMIALGVIGLDQAEQLLKAGFKLAETSAESGNARNYAACMKIAIECAKLAQNERFKLLDKQIPDQHEHTMIQRLTDTFERVRNDGDYGKLRRAAIIGHSAQPGTNGNGSGKGPLGNGSSPCTG